MQMGLHRAFCVAIVALAAAATLPLMAATKIWTGAGVTEVSSSTGWSLGANWQGGVAPAAGDSLVFPTSEHPGATNDLGAVVMDSVQVSGSSYWEIDGGTITLSNASALTSDGSAIFFAPITLLASDSTFNLTAPLGSHTFVGQITLNGGTLTVNGSSQEIVEFDGEIGEMAPSSMTVTSGYELVFEGPLTISGPTTVSAPIVIALSQTMEAGTAPIVATGDNTTFGITMHDNGPISRALDLQMSGPTTRFSISGGSTDYSGPISITGPQQFWISSNTTFSGPISGSGRLVAVLSFTLASPSNSFSGGLEVQSGATLTAGAVSTIPSSGELVVDAQGTLAIGSFAQTVQRFTCAGTYSADSGNTLTATDVNLNGCSLQLTVPSGFNAATSSPIRLITNSGSNAVSGNVLGSRRARTRDRGRRDAVHHLSRRRWQRHRAPRNERDPYALVRLAGLHRWRWRHFHGHACAHSQRSAGVGCQRVFLRLPGTHWRSRDSDPWSGHGDYRFERPGDVPYRCRLIAQRDGLHFWRGCRYPPGDGAGDGHHRPARLRGHVVGPARSENGWGMSLIAAQRHALRRALHLRRERQSDVARDAWRVRGTPTHVIYSGSLYAPTGSPFYAYDATRFVAGDP